MSAPPCAADEFLIRGLLARMPDPKSEWTLPERARWLRTLAVNLAMIYGEKDEGEIVIQAPITKSQGAALLGELQAAINTSKPKLTAAAAAAVVQQPSPGGDLDDDVPF